MTDINKVRDEVCDNPEFNIGDTKMDALLLSNRKWSFDQAIAHLSKQSVAFDEARAAMFGVEQMKIGVSTDSAVIRGMRLEHQQTSLIYEARLAVAVEALKVYGFDYAIFDDDAHNDNNGILIEAKKASRNVDNGKTAREALRAIGEEV